MLNLLLVGCKEMSAVDAAVVEASFDLRLNIGVSEASRIGAKPRRNEALTALGQTRLFT
jgi:hypothetical protein